ncbi:MAG TPA: AAA family ATPase [Candidatus Polarisedimenticolaceae bacterium]
MERIEGIDDKNLEARLREAARTASPDRPVDELELRHLMRVVTACSLLRTDVYSEDRIARIMTPDRTLLPSLVGRLIEEERRGDGEVLYRVRRLPEDVRRVGDKALFDAGLLGLRQVHGIDLAELGARAYLAASETLRLLAEDRRLREFFRQNKLLVLPVEDEVAFLRQCSDRFPQHAGILRHLQAPVEEAEGSQELRGSIAVLGAVEDAYLEAARGDEPESAALDRHELISAYERMVLFSALDVDRIRTALDATVVDQPRAVQALCDELGLFASGTRDLRKPPAFFLVGPTGVGKNHLVESLVRLLEGLWQIEVPMLTLEGPNFTYPSDIHELRGATRGFIRSDEEGILAVFHEKACRAPVSVILVDEVEKAHPHLRTFFLGILDRGTVTDNRGRVLNFSNSIVFFTSNLGYSEQQQRGAPIGFGDDEAREGLAGREVAQDLRRALSPEFVNRVRMIHFDRLSRSSASRILDLELDRIARRWSEVHGLRLALDPSAREELLRRGFSPLFGARHLAAVLENVCNVEIARKIRRDDRRGSGDRDALVRWLRELRQGPGTFDADEVRRRVHGMVRADVGYDGLRIVWNGAAFEYVAETAGEAGA